MTLLEVSLIKLIKDDAHISVNIGDFTKIISIKKCSKIMLLQVSLLTLFNYDTFKVSLKTLIKMALHRSVIVD